MKCSFGGGLFVWQQKTRLDVLLSKNQMLCKYCSNIIYMIYCFLRKSHEKGLITKEHMHSNSNQYCAM